MKKYSVYILIGAGLFAAGWFAKPEEVRTEIKTVEIIKEVKVKDSVTHKVITEKPDGTKVTEIKTESRTETNTAKNSQTDTSISAIKPQWSTGAYVSVLGDRSSYLLTVDRRIIGSIFVGIYGQTDLLTQHEVGVGVRLEF